MAEGAVTEFVPQGLFMVLLHLVEVDLAVGSVELDVILFKGLIVLDGALIKLLLDTTFANRFVSHVIQLSNQQVAYVFLQIFAHNTIDGGNLLFERHDLLHELLANLLILY